MHCDHHQTAVFKQKHTWDSYTVAKATYENRQIKENEVWGRQTPQCFTLACCFPFVNLFRRYIFVNIKIFIEVLHVFMMPK